MEAVARGEVEGAAGASSGEVSGMLPRGSDLPPGLSRHIFFEMQEIFNSASLFLAAHAILMIATVVHGTPTLEPYNYLLYMMRTLSIMFLISALLRCANYFLVMPDDAARKFVAMGS